jgi:hypothetical protein
MKGDFHVRFCENLRVQLPRVTRLAASASGQIRLRMKKQIRVSGTYKLDNKTDSFTGIVTFDEREHSIYYSWTLLDEKGKSIAGKSLNVTFQQIPAGHDKFEYSKAHAIEGIKKIRIERQRIVQELSVI